MKSSSFIHVHTLKHIVVIIVPVIVIVAIIVVIEVIVDIHDGINSQKDERQLGKGIESCLRWTAGICRPTWKTRVLKNVEYLKI